mmetsp:Transcript_4804/g.6085  ORF Transcript_4804/g.6085 Transcript_4804/m.6085 type:complete len:163 (+) Transcript_4804:113-601(+)
MPCSLEDRIKILFKLYENDENPNQISVLQLSNILSNENDKIEVTLSFLENLVQGMRKITWAQFKEALMNEVVVLDCFLQQQARKYHLKGPSESSLIRRFIHRVNLSWKNISEMWDEFVSSGKISDDSNTKQLPGYIDGKEFRRILIKYFVSAEPDDGKDILN